MKYGSIMALPKRIQHLLKPLNLEGKFQYLHEKYTIILGTLLEAMSK